MEYEIDFIPVGDGERSGDAICLRYLVDGGNSWIVGVIDGGNIAAGESICEHIRQFYGTSTVDFVICTHPDQDHASGLAAVLDNLHVRRLLMHCPWDYIDYFFDRVTDGRVSKESLRQRLVDGHPYAHALYEKARAKDIPILHPFSDGDNPGIECLTIAGPSGQYYLDQLVNFRSITQITEDAQATGLLGAATTAFKKATNWLAESWDDEKLVDPEDNATSSENSSSVITHFNFDGKQLLFTGDAGADALTRAADKLESLGEPLANFSLFQIPHHGSKRNIGPTILDRLVGPPKAAGSPAHFNAFVSAAPDGAPKHPNKRVTNALRRRGGDVIATLRSKKCLPSSGAPDRGWSKAEPLPFYDQVEDDD